ncbi:MAG: TIGR02444 family protein [Oceanicaulis sp.]
MTPPAAKAPAKPGFWSFSTAVYSRAGVKEACLSLQDAGLDVNVALWIIWTAVTGRDPGPALGQAVALSALWRARVVQPLRQARDGLKPAPECVGAQEAAALRKQILAAELEGERLQQAALAALAPSCPPHADGDLPALCRARLSSYAEREGASAATGAFVETVFSALKTV